MPPGPRAARARRPAHRNIEGKPTVLVAEKLGSAGIDLLKKIANVDCSYNLTPEELCARSRCATRSSCAAEPSDTREVFEASNGRLKVVGRAGVGIATWTCTPPRRRAASSSTRPTANTGRCRGARHRAAHRHVAQHRAGRRVHEASGRAGGVAGEWKRSKYIGTSLVDKTLAVLGFGKVGSEVARRAKGAGHARDRARPVRAGGQGARHGVELVSLDDALQRADFISLHMPLTAATDKLLNDDAFAKAKRGVRIVNLLWPSRILLPRLDPPLLVSLPQIVAPAHNRSPRHASSSRSPNVLPMRASSPRAPQAALDVFTEEPPAADSALVLHPNVIATPHLGASTTEAQEGVAVEIAEAVVGALMGELASTAVNAPMVPAEVLEELAPYVELAEKLGRLAVQLVSGGAGVKDVKVTYRTGRSSEDLDTRLLRAMIAKGLIEPISNAFINLVNADTRAPSRGRQGEGRRAAPDPGGAVQHGHRAGGQPAAVPPGGPAGMIGTVGMLLGSHDVNISFMSVGRTGPRKQALMAIGVDEEPSREVLRDINSIPALEEMVFLKL
ncbi:unnamed protein product [Closterium sp. NIES-65]|nr:unnamed protein product [Closterium sp. NIES-65]